MKGRLRDEGGFTLPEVLVSMVMMALVLFALYAMFDAAVRVFDAGRDASEAAQNARQGLARMEREIRAAYPQDKAGGDETLLTEFGGSRVTFGNDLDGDRTVSGPEKVSFATTSGGLPTRNGARIAEFAGDVDGDGRALTFEYLDAQGGPVTDGDERKVSLVEIKLEISVDRAEREPVERTLRTTVALRNR